MRKLDRKRSKRAYAHSMYAYEFAVATADNTRVGETFSGSELEVIRKHNEAGRNISNMTWGAFLAGLASSPDPRVGLARSLFSAGTAFATGIADQCGRCH